MIIKLSELITTRRSLWILFVFLVLTFIVIMIGLIKTYGFFTSEIIEGIQDLEHYRIEGFKTGFYIGTACSFFITILFISVVWVTVKLIDCNHTTKPKTANLSPKYPPSRYISDKAKGRRTISGDFRQK